MPLIRAARVVKCRATGPVSWPGYPCLRASCMARYLRRLSLIADSFWIGGSFQREYAMRQPLNHLFQNDLAKCPVENSAIRIHIPNDKDIFSHIDPEHIKLWMLDYCMKHPADKLIDATNAYSTDFCH